MNISVIRNFVAVLLFASFCSGESFLGGRIAVSHIPVANRYSASAQRTTHGYAEYRFRVQNTDSRPHSVRIALPADTFSGSGNQLSRLSNSIEVGPGDSVILTLLQPPVAIVGGNEAFVEIDGRRELTKITMPPLYEHASEFRSTNLVANVLISSKVSTGMRDLIEKGGTDAFVDPMAIALASPVTEEIGLWRSEVDASEWSDNWLAFSRFDGICLTDAELNGLKKEIFDSIRRYVESGGNLYVIGTQWKEPSEWELARVSNRKFEPMLGSVFVTGKESEEATGSIGDVRKAFLGSARRWAAAMQSGNRVYGGASGLLGGDNRLYEMLPVVKEFGVPIRTIMILILVFAVLIGPVNVYVLSVMNKRIWLLWTVPAISVLASVLVFGVNFVKEGFLRQQSSRTQTILDQRTGEAITYGFVGFYSTMTPRAGLQFDKSSEMTAAFDRSGSGRSFEANNSSGQHFSRGWINARLPSYFAVRKAEPRRERLEFNWEENTVLNGLGADIKKLLVCSPTGEHFAIGELEKGAKGTLEKTENLEAGPQTEAVSAELRKDFESVDRWTTRPDENRGLARQMYKAELEETERNPFLEEGLDAKTYSNRTSVIGFY